MWNKKYKKCIKCGTSERKYAGNGLCTACYQREYRKNNPEKIKEYKKVNLEKFREYSKKWNKNNLEKRKEINKKNHFKRLHTDSRYKLKCNISNLIGIRLRFRLSSKSGKSTFSFLPYTVDDLIRHLESLFKPGMNWTNYGDWHIDHIRPDCKFDYKNVEDEEFQRCWALSNLQPLWAEDNIRKNGKYN